MQVFANVRAGHAGFRSTCFFPLAVAIARCDNTTAPQMFLAVAMSSGGAALQFDE